MNFMLTLRVRTRFLLLGLLGLVMAGVPMAMYVQKSLADMDSTRLELGGIAPARDMISLIRLTQQHRGLSALVLGGNAASQADRAAKQKEVEAAVAQLSQDLAALDDARTRAGWDKNKQDWSAIAAGLASGSLNAEQSFSAHSVLLKNLLRTLDFVADAYGLSLDPEYGSYELVRATLYEGPALTEDLGKARGKGAGMLAAGSASPQDRMALGVYLGMADKSLDEVQNAFAKAMDVDAHLKTVLGEQISQAQAQGQEALQVATSQILTVDSYTYSGKEYFSRFSTAIESQYAVIGTALQELDSVLDARLHQQRSSVVYLSAALLLLALLGLTLSVYAARSVLRELGAEPGAVMAVAEAIRKGDLTTPIAVQAGLETSVVGSMGRMQESLRGIVAQVRQSSDGVAMASSEIAQGNQDLSARTESQASVLEETAAAMEQVSSQVRHNADNARQADQLATEASAVAVRGGEVVGRVVATMKDINVASRKISDIISVIDGIAFQTNILALNAAVEAARAGEQGRGFAVVASEVRSLAGRSAEAAREIKSLISASVERVEHGTVLVDEAGSTMNEVVTAIRKVSDLVGEISSASNEQSIGVGQVGESVARMDQVTQQNAALVEQMAAAAGSLKAQAGELVRVVAVFNVGAAAHLPRVEVRSSTARSTPFQGEERRAVASTAARPPAARPPAARSGAASTAAGKAASQSQPAQAAKAPPASAAPAQDDGWDTF